MMNEKVERERAEALAAESAMETELRDPAISMDLTSDEGMYHFADFTLSKYHEINKKYVQNENRFY